MNKKEAAQKMISQEMSAIPLALIEKAYQYIDGFDNVTPIVVGDYVIYEGEGSEVLEVRTDENDDNQVLIEFDGVKEWVNAWEVDLEDPAILPMWGTVWHAADSLLNNFIKNNMDMVAACGFEIYMSDVLDGYILGINGAGYDFYEAHWIPLYEAQGLKWHDEA